MLLISRTEAKLAAASQEIASKFNVQTKYTVVDFAHADEATWRRTAAVMSTLNIGVLINNVALSYDHPEYLEQLSEQQIREMIEVNITSVNQVTSFRSPLAHLLCLDSTVWYGMQMTLMALPAMKDHKKGIIVNIGSASGSVVPASPLTSVYAGTKVSDSFTADTYSILDQWKFTCWLPVTVRASRSIHLLADTSWMADCQHV